MTHLTEAEFVDLLEGALPPARRAHLESCDGCRAQAVGMDAVLAQTSESLAADVPEPSPLFWDHFSTRLRETLAEPAATSWRDRLWPGAAWAAGLASVALAAAISHDMLTRTVATPPPVSAVLSGPAAASGMSAAAPGGAEQADDIETDEAWALVRSVADQVEWDEAHEAGISARPGAAERMTLELSAREQSELARLLHRELERTGT